MSDRPRIRKEAYSETHPDRIVVFRAAAPASLVGVVRLWEVWQGTAHRHSFHTHAEAITAAQKLAHQP